MLMYFIVGVREPLEMGRESSLGMKELFNLPPLVLKAGVTSVVLPFAQR